MTTIVYVCMYIHILIGVDSNIGIKAKRRYAGGPGKHIYPIYQKLTEILDALSHLLMVQNHTDTFVLQVWVLSDINSENICMYVCMYVCVYIAQMNVCTYVLMCIYVCAILGYF